MQAAAHCFDHSRVVALGDHRIRRFQKQLQAALPAGSRVSGRYRADMLEPRVAALTISLPARPNPMLPGRDRPATGPFAIEVARDLLVADTERLADWMAMHIAAASDPSGADEHDTPAWRFTGRDTDKIDVQIERPQAATAHAGRAING